MFFTALEIITEFLISIRDLFVWRVEHEIYRRIAPHIRNERDNKYQFKSREELRKHIQNDQKETAAYLAYIERGADGMGEAYGEAFRYIMYRDINERLSKYHRLMRRRTRPTTCDPRFVATRA